MPSHQILRLGSLFYWLIAKKNQTDLPECQFKTIRIAAQREKKILECQNSKHVTGSLCVVVPGLSPIGPDDMRLRRLGAILANTGYRVLIPYIEDFMAMHVKPQTQRDFEEIFEFALKTQKQQQKKVTLISVSFGSLLSLRLCSNPKYQKSIEKPKYTNNLAVKINDGDIMDSRFI